MKARERGRDGDKREGKGWRGGGRERGSDGEGEGGRGRRNARKERGETRSEGRKIGGNREGGRKEETGIYVIYVDTHVVYGFCCSYHRCRYTCRVHLLL